MSISQNENNEESVSHTIESTDEEISNLSMADYEDLISQSFTKHEVGSLLTGTVIGVSDTEIILDLRSYSEGIIPANEMSNDPRFSLKADVTIGDAITALVLGETKEGAILLSKKQAEDQLSWAELKKLMDHRTVVTVKPAEAVNSGVVTYLLGIRAFIPASQLSSVYVEDVASFLHKDIEVLVITVEEANKKLVLSAKEHLRDKEEENRVQRINRLIPGTIVTGTVDKLMPFGAFISLGNGLSGLVHISQISEKRIKSPGEILKVGEQVTVKLLSVKDGKISLSIKAVTEETAKEAEDTLEEAPFEYSSGESVSTGLGSLLSKFKLQ